MYKLYKPFINSICNLIPWNGDWMYAIYVFQSSEKYLILFAVFIMNY